MQDSGRGLHPIPCNKGNEPRILDEADAPIDDELSSSSFLPLGPSPTKNTRAKLLKRASHRLAFSDAISGASRRTRRKAGKG